MYIVTFIIWVTWAYKYFSEQGQIAITNGGLIGIKAFLIANINLWVFLGFIIGLILIIYTGKNN